MLEKVFPPVRKRFCDLSDEDFRVIKDALRTYNEEIIDYIINLEQFKSSDKVKKEINQLISDQIGPIAKLDKIQFVSGLPKTRSGKILRGTMRKIADNQQYTAPATIEDPQTLDLVRTTLTRMGYADALVG